MHPPALLQINTRFWIHQRSSALGRQASLDDLPDEELRRFSDLGFEWLYLLGMWQSGPVEAEIARQQDFLQKQAASLLGSAGPDAICASVFAISGYQVRPEWGGGAALKRLRARLHACGLRLMLDFIPNHTGLSHPWVARHPDYYIQASPEALDRQPETCRKVQTVSGERILAHGRDPFFPAWTDTFQLNYANPALQQAMLAELLTVSGLCDGLRCDMAMLILPEIFERTWGMRPDPFWPGAIERLKAVNPSFIFLAEVYWGLDSVLVNQGFDYTYDKALLDRLVESHAPDVRHQIQSSLDIQPRQVHFLENHDEPRIASRLPIEAHRAAALIAFFQPGMRFFFSGQLEGHRIKAPIQFCRPPDQIEDPLLKDFYALLLNLLKSFTLQPGAWALLESRPAWEANWTREDFIAFTWLDDAQQRWLAAVNYSDHQSQCYLQLPFEDLAGRNFSLKDQLSQAAYERPGSELAERGLYLDLPPWGIHLFVILVQK